VFAKLLFAHLMADFVFQTSWLVQRKQRWDGLFLHTGLVFLVMIGVAWEDLEGWWYWLVCLAALHAVTDWGKLRLDQRARLRPIITFLGDQAVHVSAALAVTLLYSVLTRHPLLLSQSFDDSALPWWIANLYILCTFAASIALPTWLAPGSLMKRPGRARWAIILAGAILLTLTWQGLYLALLPVAAWFFGLAVVWQDHTPTMITLHWEVLSASALAVGAGWVLN